MEYTVSDTVHPLEDISNLTMSDFHDSFFFMLRLKISDQSIKSFNWHDNPYIAANVYQWDQDSYSKNENIVLSECKKGELLKLMTEETY